MITKRKTKKLFLVTINVTSESDIGFSIGETIKTAVFTNNAISAKSKIKNKYWGSEYPTYDIVSVEALDAPSFEPILQ